MLLNTLSRRHNIPCIRLLQMTSHLSNGATNGLSNRSSAQGVSLAEIPKSNVFTSSLPPDSKFPAPIDSFQASRDELGPRMVKGALYTFVRPEEKKNPVLLGFSKRAMKDIGLQEGEEESEDFSKMVAGNKIMWNRETKEGIYPWAQCYGGQYEFWNDEDIFTHCCRMAIV